jgi:hypothetical protein
VNHLLRVVRRIDGQAPVDEGGSPAREGYISTDSAMMNAKATSETAVSMTDQDLNVSPTVKPNDSLTSQKPASKVAGDESDRLAWTELSPYRPDDSVETRAGWAAPGEHPPPERAQAVGVGDQRVRWAL